MPEPHAMTLCLDPSDPAVASLPCGVVSTPRPWLPAPGSLSFRLRSVVEADEGVLQLCSYGVVFLPENRVLAYRRPGGDDRLTGRVSVGFGGHVEPCDWPVSGDVGLTTRDGETPIPTSPAMIAAARSFVRESEEEFGEPVTGEAAVIGLIRDDGDHVGRCHLGVLFAVGLRELPPGTEETGKLWAADPRDLLAAGELESWSRIAIANALAVAFIDSMKNRR